MCEHHSWYIGSVWHKEYVGQWSIFYGPVILLHNLKTIWWRNVVLGITDHCDTKIDLFRISVTYSSWAIDFAFYCCYRLKLFVYIKKWHQLGVFVPLQALALVWKFFLLFDITKRLTWISVLSCDVTDCFIWKCIISSLICMFYLRMYPGYVDSPCVTMICFHWI